MRSQLSLVHKEGNNRSEDPGDEEEVLEPTVQIADQQFFKMADGKLQRLPHMYSSMTLGWIRLNLNLIEEDVNLGKPRLVI